jgi:hypothetical protein
MKDEGWKTKRQWGAKELIKWNGMTGLELFFRGSLAALSAIARYLCEAAFFYLTFTIED